MKTYLYSNLTVFKPLILGASCGLGFELLNRYPDAVGCSRSLKNSVDFSKQEAVKKVMKFFHDHEPDAIFYVAGGGPHGDFFSKPFSSHRWAYEVNYFTPIGLVYELMARKYNGVFIYIGSAIAERSTFDQSISYSQAKKMAKQSLLSIEEKKLKVRIFSPPYMNTKMLTKNAWPRIQAPELVLEPREVVDKLIKWLKNLESFKGKFDMRHFDWLENFKYDIPLNKKRELYE